jgi:hypothetical protein
MKNATSMPIDKSLEKLRAASARLNKSTDELNGTIERLEKQLAEMKIGVAVWLGLALDSSLINDEKGDEETAWDVGYCKVGLGNWRIAARLDRRRVGEGWVTIEGPVPLASGPRVVRVLAAPHLEKLVLALAEKAEEYADGADKANADAKK